VGRFSLSPTLKKNKFFFGQLPKIAKSAEKIRGKKFIFHGFWGSRKIGVKAFHSFTEKKIIFFLFASMPCAVRVSTLGTELFYRKSKIFFSPFQIMCSEV
jgi:hypothetical protein